MNQLAFVQPAGMFYGRLFHVRLGFGIAVWDFYMPDVLPRTTNSVKAPKE